LDSKIISLKKERRDLQRMYEEALKEAKDWKHKYFEDTSKGPKTNGTDPHEDEEAKIRKEQKRREREEARKRKEEIYRLEEEEFKKRAEERRLKLQSYLQQ